MLEMESSSLPPPLTIIVVEDNPLDVRLIRWVLEAHAFPGELQVITNGEDALAVFDQLAAQAPLPSPTLVLLDLALPQQDGLTLLRRLKGSPQGAVMRVVIVTSSADPKDRAEALALGADGFFQKPFQLTPFMQLGELIKGLAFGSAPAGAPPEAAR
jgi:CheY-like chemotaxis protein